MRAQFLQQEKLEFKHLCDDWREGSIGKKPLTSRCRPDEKKQRFDCCIQIALFHFSSCRFSFLCLCFVVFASVLGIDSVELKVLAIE